MSDNKTLTKLQLSDQNPILIMNYPEEYQKNIDDVSADIHHTPKQKYRFIHVFVKSLEEIGNTLKKR